MDKAELKLTRVLTQIRLKQTGGVLDVMGVSMEPLIFEGDNLLIEEQSSYSVGDIVVVVDMNCRILVHRIIRFEGDIIVTKGDNTVGIDESFRENCIGRINCIYPKDLPGREIYPYKPFTDRFILLLSNRMNKKFIKGIPGDKLFKGWERKCIIFIEKLLYRRSFTKFP